MTHEAELDLIKANIRRSLGALSRLCVAPFLFEAVVVKLFTKLELCCRPSASRQDSEGIMGVTDSNEEGKADSTLQDQLKALQEAGVGYARGLILTLQTMVDLKKANGHKDLVKYAHTLPTRLVSLTLSGLDASGESGELSIAAHPAVVAELAALLGTFVKLLDANKQRELLASLNKTFVRGSVPFVEAAAGSEASTSAPALIAASSPLAQSFAPFSTASSPSAPFTIASRNAVALLSAAVVASNSSAGVVLLTTSSSAPTSKHDAALSSLSTLLEWTLTASTLKSQSKDETAAASQSLQLNSGYWLLAALSNKFIDETSPAFLDTLDAFWSAHIKSPSSSAVSTGAKRRVALQVWMWLTRALVVKSSKIAEAMLNRILIEIFDDISGKVSTTQLVQNSTSSEAGKQGESEWKFARAAARDLSAIVGVSDDGIATKENGFTVRLLWKQKLFSFLLPRLLDSYQSAAKKSHSHSHDHAHGEHCSHDHHGGSSEDDVDARQSTSSRLQDCFRRSHPRCLSSDSKDSSLYSFKRSLYPIQKRAPQRRTPSPSQAKSAKSSPHLPPSLLPPLLFDLQPYRPHRFPSYQYHHETAHQHFHHPLFAPFNPHCSPAHTYKPSCKARRRRTGRQSSRWRIGTHHLHPLRNVVLKELGKEGKGIDDKVRSVRSVAVDARDAWFAVSET